MEQGQTPHKDGKPNAVPEPVEHGKPTASRGVLFSAFG